MLTDQEQEDIRRKLWEFEAEPPALGWKKVDEELRPKRRWRGWLWLLPAFILLSAGAFLLWPGQASDPVLPTREEGIAAVQSPSSGTPKPTAQPQHWETESKPSGNKALAPPIAEKSSGSESKPVAAKQSRMNNESLPEVATWQGEIDHPMLAVPELPASARKFKRIRQSAVAPNRKKYSEPEAVVLPSSSEIPSSETVDRNEVNQPVTSRKQTHAYLSGRGIQSVYIPARYPQLHFPADTEGMEELAIVPVKQRPTTSKEWTLGIFFTPRYAFRKFIPTVSDEILITGLTNKNQSNTERVGYELGLQVSKAIRPNLYLESSLAFVQLRENLSYSYTTNKIDTLIRTVTGNNQLEVTPIYQTGQRQLISSYAYGNWRLGASYYFWQTARRRFSVNVSGGINLLVKGQTRQYTNGTLEETVVFPSRDNILEQKNYNLSLGVGYHVAGGRHYELTMMPTFNYFLGSTFQAHEPFGLRPYSIGVQVQIRRRFVN